MTYIFVTLLATALLIIEGRLLFGIVARTRSEHMIAWSLGLPLGTLINVLIFFGLHLIRIPFSITSVGMGHGIILVILGTLFLRKYFLSPLPNPLPEGEGRKETPQTNLDHRTRILKISLLTLCITFITLTLLSAFIYVTVLPGFYWDIFTHWAMRAKQSLYAGSFVIEGVVQPQYPILLHSLMMLPAVFAEWNDRWVHLITFFLSLSQILSIFLMIRKRCTRETALITLTLLLSVPLVAIHLRQGYADIHVAFFILLSALFLDAWSKDHSPTLLSLSALLCAAAAWTKFEGLYFGVLPWMGIVGWKILYVMVSPVESMIYKVPKKSSLLLTLALTLVLALPWPLYVLLSGMPPSPHAIELMWNINAFPMILKSLFMMGSFGLHWWAIGITSIVLLIVERKRIFEIAAEHPSLIWADLILILLIAIYLFTNESEGLTVGHNFSRAMILPTLLYTQTLSILYMKLGGHKMPFLSHKEGRTVCSALSY